MKRLEVSHGSPDPNLGPFRSTSCLGWEGCAIPATVERGTPCCHPLFHTQPRMGCIRALHLTVAENSVVFLSVHNALNQTLIRGLSFTPRKPTENQSRLKQTELGRRLKSSPYVWSRAHTHPPCALQANLWMLFPPRSPASEHGLRPTVAPSRQAMTFCLHFSFPKLSPQV